MRHYFRVAAFVLALAVVGFAVSSPAKVDAQRVKRRASAQKARGAVPSVRFDSGDRVLGVPLEIDNNIILLRVRVNGSEPLRFIFDTGASHTVISSRRAAELGLKAEGRFSGNATGGAIRGSVVKGVSLGVKGAEVSNLLVASMPFETPPGFDFDGIIGSDFIRQFVVEIDYQGKTMNLYDPRAFRYKGGGEALPLILTGSTPLVRAEVTLEGRAPFEARLEVDTGADGTFLFNSPFVKKRNLPAAFPKAAQESASGGGGEQRRLVGRAKAVKLGRVVLDNPPVGLSLDTEGSGASEANDGLVGGEVLRRFKVILDYSRGRMILEPNGSLKDPFEVDDGRD
jgi:predicted aspartyl protease